MGVQFVHIQGTFTHRIHGAGIYANIWGILMGNFRPSSDTVSRTDHPSIRAGSEAMAAVSLVRGSVRPGRQHVRRPGQTSTEMEISSHGGSRVSTPW